VGIRKGEQEEKKRSVEESTVKDGDRVVSVDDDPEGIVA